MFGYITPSRKNLTKEEISKYKSYYCGICHEIGRQYGKKSTFCLSYDMVFLALLLSDLYNEEETRGKEKCAVHPIKEHYYTITKAITYSADVNVILSYYSLLDHVHDDGKEENRLSRIAGYMPSLKEKYPDKIKKLEKQLSILTEREQKNEKNAIMMASIFSEGLACFFDYMNDPFFSPTLLSLGDAVGRFSYLRDAYEDRHKDERKNQYNPLVGMTEDEIGELLFSAASDASMAFEKLPLDDNINILRNILYGGIWKNTKWDKLND